MSGKHIIVIGGGPAGYSAALELGKSDVRVTLIEEKNIGGVCVHQGCIPTRSHLLAVKAAMQAQDFSAGPVELDLTRMSQQAAAKSQRLAFGMEYMLQRSGIQIRRGRAAVVKAVPAGEQRVLLSDGSEISGDAVLIAAGSEEKIQDVPDGVRVWPSEELLKLQSLPQAITVVGGGVLGVELSVILAGAGCRVVLREKAKQILPGWDQDIARHLESWLRAQGIEVQLEAAGTGDARDAAFCIGREPRGKELLENDCKNASWLYFAGDAAGGSMTADHAMEEGRTAARRILEDLGEFCRGGIGRSGMVSEAAGGQAGKAAARCVFTPLEAAMTGESDSPVYKSAYIETEMQPCGQIFGTEYGFVKAVMNKEDHVLKGFHILSSMASELIAVCQVAVAREMTAEEFLDVTFVHPVESELLQEAVRRLL